MALGGGGARGYAHIGVLEVLEERGYEVVSIAGSSMGAARRRPLRRRRLDAYSDWVRGLTHRDVLRLYDLSPRAPGAIRAERIFARVGDILGDAAIEDLPMRFTAVATDLETGEERWFQDGPVNAAIRASAALPGFMTPVVLDGRLLADGGLTDPLPLAAASGPSDLTVAVAVAGRRRPDRGSTPPAAARGAGPPAPCCGGPRRTSSTARSSGASGPGSPICAVRRRRASTGTATPGRGSERVRSASGPGSACAR